jgi:hypothetical protein
MNTNEFFMACIKKHKDAALRVYIRCTAHVNQWNFFVKWFGPRGAA